MGAITRIGSAYGGWNVDLGLIPDGATVISAGIGNDLSFDKFLIEHRNAHMVLVDPNSIAHEAIVSSGLTVTHIPAALWKNDEGVDFGAERSNGAGAYSTGRMLHVGSISIDSLLARFPGTALLKMDVEGAEYDALEAWSYAVRPTQVCVGFHTQKGSLRITETSAVIVSHGYRCAIVEDEGPEKTMLFIREDR